MPTVSVNQVSLEYRWWGSPSPSRPPILLIHDAFGSVNGWGDWPNRLALARGCRVYAYSRQGFGDSEPLTAPLPADYVQHEALDVLPMVREALRLEEDVVLMGLHDGAAIALVHAGGGAQPVAALAAITPLVQVDETTHSAIWALSRSPPPALAKTDSHQDHTFQQWAALWTSAGFAGWNVDDFLAGVTCPVLAARGDKDEFTSHAHVDRLLRLVHEVGVATLPGCRHQPHLDKPGVLTQAIDTFLNGVR
jgi:pimeloyl-ACP methyl ester carboxylesterase